MRDLKDLEERGEAVSKEQEPRLKVSKTEVTRE